jgi:hypothetical protein
MKLIAKVTLVTPGGSIAPGGEVEVKDDAEAASLVERGFAEAVAPKGKLSRSAPDEPGPAVVPQ